MLLNDTEISAGGDDQDNVAQVPVQASADVGRLMSEEAAKVIADQSGQIDPFQVAADLGRQVQDKGDRMKLLFATQFVDQVSQHQHFGGVEQDRIDFEQRLTNAFMGVEQ